MVSGTDSRLRRGQRVPGENEGALRSDGTVRQQGVPSGWIMEVAPSSGSVWNGPNWPHERIKEPRSRTNSAADIEDREAVCHGSVDLYEGGHRCLKPFRSSAAAT